ncbi:MAG: MerR family transcriptional regulator [bacterium]|nr:MerR family transcriptional regulator [bacterium]
MAEASSIPRKKSYRSSEVCQYTDTQPYVLNFWESEFPQLSPDKTRTGQSMYRREDIDIVLRIKQLLYDEEFTIASARERLDRELKGEVEPGARAKVVELKQPDERPPAEAVIEDRTPWDAVDEPDEAAAASKQDVLSFDSVARERYEDAVDEISHLRLQLKEAETQARRAVASLEKSELATEGQRRRADLAVQRLERVLELLDPPARG